MPSRDFRDLFAEFNAAGVEYLVVGAHALAFHGHIRATKDMDVWITIAKVTATPSLVHRRSRAAVQRHHGTQAGD
jgi:hypothetical protein